jgi:hypothetical protein
LCEVMLEELLQLIGGSVDLEIRDIDTRADWREKYDVRVPVVECDGRVISEYPLNSDAIRGILPDSPENVE